jgi:small GTP-binding protein
LGKWPGRDREIKLMEDTVKLIALGDSSVGKTSLILRYTEDWFASNSLTTIGIDVKFKTLRLSDRDIKLQIWDPAGQEKYRTITKSFYQRADGVLLMFDLTNPQSLEQVSLWMSQIKENAEADISVVLAGNKADLVESEEESLGSKVAAHYGIEFYCTSAKTGLNVDTAFTQLVQQVLGRKQYRQQGVGLKTGSHSTQRRCC